ncbi:MAG: glycosyl hydrolase family 28 protein [Prevotella sp.]|nr:glycosyl hydrolase family 28 protein [Prevotella sp.]
MKYISISFLLLLLLAPRALYAGETDVYNVMNYGATGDGTTDDAAAIQAAIDLCAASGGGQVLIPAGHTFLAGPLHIASNINLHIEKGARLLALPDEEAYTESAFRQNEGEGMMWISGENISNFSITGGGTIDGNGVFFMGEEREDSYDLKPVTTFDPRPHVLTIIGGENININNVTFANSAYWTVHLVGCREVLVKDVTINNNVKIRNSDGIDLDHTRNAKITNCTIQSGDDCICLKNRREYAEYGACQDITITGCKMTSRSCAFKIGSENVDEIKNVVVSDCVITGSNRGIGIQNRDEGTVRNVSFENIAVDCRLFSDVWWGKAEPVYITSYPRAAADNKDGNWRFPEGATEGICGEVADITLKDIRCDSENGVFIGGDTGDKVKNISINNLQVNISKTTDYPGGVYDRRPCEGEEFVSDNTYGIYIDRAKNVVISNPRITFSDDKRDNASQGVMVARGSHVLVD